MICEQTEYTEKQGTQPKLLEMNGSSIGSPCLTPLAEVEQRPLHHEIDRGKRNPYF